MIYKEKKRKVIWGKETLKSMVKMTMKLEMKKMMMRTLKIGKKTKLQSDQLLVKLKKEKPFKVSFPCGTICWSAELNFIKEFT